MNRKAAVVLNANPAANGTIVAITFICSGVNWHSEIGVSVGQFASGAGCISTFARSSSLSRRNAKAVAVGLSAT